jgi:hypothetical protein
LTRFVAVGYNRYRPLSFKDNFMSSIASEDSRKLKELAAIRTQGLIGMAVLLLTLGSMTYRARSVEANVQQNIADAALAGLGNAKADLQSMFDSASLEHNLELLRRHATFGHDFVPGWMLFITFLYRALMVSRPAARHTYVAAGVILVATWVTNAFVTSALDRASQQPVVTDAMLRGVYFQAQLKWIFFFFDAFLCGFYLFMSPLVVRIGAVILVVSSSAGMVCMAIPFGLLMPYCVLGLFVGFTGLSILLLFNPQLFVPPLRAQ